MTRTIMLCAEIGDKYEFGYWREEWIIVNGSFYFIQNEYTVMPIQTQTYTNTHIICIEYVRHMQYIINGDNVDRWILQSNYN